MGKRIAVEEKMEEVEQLNYYGDVGAQFESN